MKAVQHLLYRIAVKRLIEAFEALLLQKKISQRQLSEEAGMSPNAFAGTKSEVEDPNLSTFLRYLEAASRILSEKGQPDISVDALLKNPLKIINLAHQFSLADPKDFSTTEMKLFNSLKEDVHILIKKGAASQEEINAFNELYSYFDSFLRRHI